MSTVQQHEAQKAMFIFKGYTAQLFYYVKKSLTEEYVQMITLVSIWPSIAEKKKKFE